MGDAGHHEPGYSRGCRHPRADDDFADHNATAALRL